MSEGVQLDVFHLWNAQIINIGVACGIRIQTSLFRALLIIVITLYIIYMRRSISGVKLHKT